MQQDHRRETLRPSAASRKQRMRHLALTKIYTEHSGNRQPGLASLHAVYTLLGYDANPVPVPGPSSAAKKQQLEQQHGGAASAYKHTACRREWQMRQ